MHTINSEMKIDGLFSIGLHLNGTQITKKN